MGDLAPGIGAERPPNARQSEELPEDSPTSDRASRDLEKDLEKGETGDKSDDLEKSDDVQGVDKGIPPPDDPQTIMVEWDGPDDPEWPQNL